MILKNDQEMKLLIVEDDSINYFLLETIIKKQYKNIEIFYAKNGKEAVEFCEKEDFIVVFMDVKMPVMDGIEATKKILKFKSYLPIVALTAFVSDDEEKKLKEAGCVEYVSKPFERKEIYRIINSYL